MKKLLSFTLIFLAFLSCKRNDIIEFHPMDERYPYHASEIQSVHFAKKILNDEDHYLFNTKSFNGAFNVQKIISTEMPFVDTDYLTLPPSNPSKKLIFHLKTDAGYQRGGWCHQSLLISQNDPPCDRRKGQA
jgi:hypothetical protein